MVVGTSAVSEPFRHNAATYQRKQYGVEMARIVLGHVTAFMLTLGVVDEVVELHMQHNTGIFTPGSMADAPDNDPPFACENRRIHLIFAVNEEQPDLAAFRFLLF